MLSVILMWINLSFFAKCTYNAFYPKEVFFFFFFVKLIHVFKVGKTGIMVRGDLEIKMLWFFSMYEVIDIDRPQKLLRTTEAFVGKKSFGKKETHSSLSFSRQKC